jgi:hypothetical protein
MRFFSLNQLRIPRARLTNRIFHPANSRVGAGGFRRRDCDPACPPNGIDEFLCRTDSVDDVARKCAELGLRPKSI